MRILGLDPGVATVGFAVLEGSSSRNLRLLSCGCIRTAAHTPLPHRVLEIHGDVSSLIAAHHPDVGVLEKLFFNKNVTTAMAVAQTRGVIMLALAQGKLPVAEYSPLEVKKAVTGYGRAVKSQVQAMVARLLKLAEPPRPDDAADAVAIALCHSFSFGTFRSR
jgi:crossover junction endodeoxyribonuclease RuvC